jgi:glycosyltransferase involved in cell wall biosynthesis
MKRRLVILTEIISPYRIPVFNALARRDDLDLHVIFLAETDRTQREWRVYKDEIRFSYQVLPSWRRRLGKHHWLLNWGVGAALKKAAPDVVLCGGYNYLASWVALAWARRRRIPFLLWVESTPQDHRSGRALVEALKTRFLRCCQAFVVPGQSSSEYLGCYGINPQSIWVAPNAVDNDFFAKYSDDARQEDAVHRQRLGLPPQFFLFAGRIVTGKGVFDLLQAYSDLPAEVRSRWGLVFAGSGPELSRLQRHASSVSPGTVHFAGFTQREELAKHYGLAGAFVLPTHSDPWGLVVNEAMAAGLPVVVSFVAGCAADLVREGWNGYLFPPGNTGYLASVLEKISGDDEQRRRMGQCSREHIRTFSPEACASGIASAVLSNLSR